MAFFAGRARGDPPQYSDLYQRGLDLMETRGDCPGAVRLFSEIALGRDRSLAARALLNIGHCYEKSRGDPGVPYRRIPTEFGDQREAANRARARLAVLGLGIADDNGPRVLTRVTVGPDPERLVLSPDGQTLYVANRGTNTLSVISTARRTVIKTVKVGNSPSALAVSPDGRRVYVGQWSGGLSVIDTAAWTIKTIPTDWKVADIALTPDGRKLYFSLVVENGLRAMDTVTYRTSAIPSDGYPMGLAVSPGGHDLYVAFQGGKKRGHDPVRRFDTVTDHLVETAEGPPNVGGNIAISPDGAAVWSSGDDACMNPSYDHEGCPAVSGGILHVFNSELKRKSPPLGFAGLVRHPVFYPDGSMVALDYEGRRLLLIDATTLATVASISIPLQGRLAFSRDGTQAWAPLMAANAVALIETTIRIPVRVVWQGPQKLRFIVLSSPRFNVLAVEVASLHLAGAEQLKPNVILEVRNGRMLVDFEVAANFAARGGTPAVIEGRTVGGVCFRGAAVPVPR